MKNTHSILFLLFFFTGQLASQKAKLVIPVGHTEGITAVAPTADGQLVFTAGKDKLIKVWTRDGRLVRTIEGPRQNVLDLVVAPTGDFYFTRSKAIRAVYDYNCFGILWDAAGREIIRLPIEADPFAPAKTTALFSPDGQSFAFQDADSLRLFDLRDASYQSYAFSGDIAYAADSQDLYLLGRVIQKLNVATGAITILAKTPKESSGLTSDQQLFVGSKMLLSPDEQFIFKYRTDQHIERLELKKRKWTTLHPGNPDFEGKMTRGNMQRPLFYERMEISPDQNHLTVYTSDGDIWLNRSDDKKNSLWTPGTRLSEVGGPTWDDSYEGELYDNYLHPISFSPDSRYLLLRNDYYQSAVVWDISQQLNSAIFNDITHGRVRADESTMWDTAPISFLPGTSNLLIGRDDGSLAEYLPTGELVRQFGAYPPSRIAAVRLDTLELGKIDVILGAREKEGSRRMVSFDLERVLLAADSSKLGINAAYHNGAHPDLRTNYDSLGEVSISGVEEYDYEYLIDNPAGGVSVTVDAGVVKYLNGTSGRASLLYPSSSQYDMKLIGGDKQRLMISHSAEDAKLYDLDCLLNSADNIPAEDDIFAGIDQQTINAKFQEDPYAFVQLKIAKEEQYLSYFTSCVVQRFRVPYRSRVHGSSEKFQETLFSKGRWLLRSSWKTGTYDSTFAHQLEIYGAEYFLDDQFILSWSQDRTVKVWDARDLSLRLTLLFLDNEEWVATSPSGLFDASPGALNELYFSVGNELIDASQLEQRYYEPKLIPKVLGLVQEGERGVDGLDAVALYPEIEAKLKGDMLSIKLRDREGGVGRTSIYLNGKEIIADVTPQPEAPGSRRPLQAEVSLKPYARFCFQDGSTPNKLSVVSHNAEGWLSSQPFRLEYYPTTARRGGLVRPKFYAIVVGTKDYRGEQLDLLYPDHDALAISVALRESATALFSTGTSVIGQDSVEVHCLSTTPQDSTVLHQRGIYWAKSDKATITDLFREVSRKAKAEDIIVIYFSGHGIAYGNSEQAQFYYLTQEVADGNLADALVREKSAISTEEITRWLNDVPALKQVLIMDACNSGTLMNGLRDNSKSLNTEQLRAMNRMKNRTGTFVITGSAADRLSYEAHQFGHGLLTYSLLQGFLGAAGDGKTVDIMRLLQFATDQVPGLAQSINKDQTPQLGIPKEGSSFDIGMIDNKVDILMNSPRNIVARSIFLNLEAVRDDAALGPQLDELFWQESKAEGSNFIFFIPEAAYGSAYTVRGLYRTEGDLVTELTVKLFSGQEAVSIRPVPLPRPVPAARLVRMLERVVYEAIEEHQDELTGALEE